MNPEEKNLSKLRNLLAVMDSASMTQEEFIESFQVVIDLAKQIQDTNAEEFESIRNEVQALSDKLAEDAKNNVFEAMDGFENKFKTAFKTIAEREVANCEKMMKAKMLEIDAEASAKIESLEVEPTPTLEEVVNALEPRIKIPTPVPGEPGKPGKDGSPDTGEEIIKKINKAETLIDPTAIKGFEQLQKDVKEKTGNTTRIGWGAHPLVVQGLGVVKDKNTRNINFKGAGVSSVVRNANGVVDVTISGGGGGGAFTDLTDVPASYTGQAVKVVRVNAGETGLEFATVSGTGDVVGPASATDNAVARFDGTTGKLIQNSAVTIADGTGNVTAGTYNGNTIGAGSTSGTNTGDQTSIVGITGTKAQFDTAVTDGNILYVGDVTQYTDEMAQDATGAMVANSTFVSLAYNDATPSLTPSLSASGTPSSSTFLRGDNTWATPAGSGTVTATGGSLTANSVVLGAGTTDTKVVAGVTTDGTSQLNLGVNATTLGAVKMFGSTSGDVTVKPAAVAGTATVFQLPATNGTNGHYLQTNGSGVTSWQAASGSAFTPVVNNYTASTTMADPGAGCTLIRVRGIAGGAGGGSGRKHTSAAGRGGGSGGSAGAFMDVQFPYSSVSSWPVTITIGAGGAGGAAVTSNSTVGNNGTAGGDTSFGAIVVLKGGDGGTGGSSATSQGGDARFGANNSVSTVATNAAPAAGGQAGATAAVTTAGANGFAGAGGAGGGLTTGNATMSGTNGGSNAKGTAAVAGGTAGNAGGAGTAGDTTAPYIFFGGNGGSGGGSSTTAGLAGGAGGLYGAGGGGGTAGTDSVNDSGAGGAGADGFLQVIAT